MKPSGRALFFVVFALTLASRLPFLGAGYGWDNDAWGNMEAARLSSITGVPHLSRPPGYPVLVGLCAYLWRGGPLVVNGITAVFSALAAALFSLILRQQGARAETALLGALALAMTPVVYLNSTVAMDYLWALAFLLAAWWLVAAGRPALAGLCLGVAVGCRITSAAFVVPLLLLLPAEFPRAVWWRRGVTLGACFIASALIAYSPVLVTEGLRYVTFSHQPWTDFLPHLLHNVTVGVWGVTGCLAVGGGFAVWVLGRALPPLIAAADRRARTAAVAAILLYVLLFLRLPAEPAYLIPAVPFVLLLFAHRLPPSAFAAVCVGLVASPWLGDLMTTRPYGDASDADGRGSLVRRWSERAAWSGAVWREDQNRRRQVAGLERALGCLPSGGARPALVSAGAFTVYLSEWRAIHPGPDPAPTFVKELSPASIAAAVAAQQNVLLFRGHDNKIVLGYLAHAGATGELQPLPLFLLDQDETGALHEAPWSSPDLALLATTLNLQAQGRVWEAVLSATWWVPVEPGRRTSRPLIHQGRRVLPAFDRPSRIPPSLVRRAGSFAERRGLDLVRDTPPGVALDLNPGQVVGWTISAQQVAELRRSLPPGVYSN